MKTKNEFNELWSNHYFGVFNFILRKVNGNKEVAEDLTQDVFIKAHKHLENYDASKGKITTWLYTFAKNKVIDFYRTNALNKTVNVSDFSDAETGKEVFQFTGSEQTNTQAENAELRAKIEQAINSLKSDYKRMAELFFYDEKQYNEIAEICNVPIGTVKGMISRCRVKLQEILQNDYANL